jgi:hypothetical protein
MKIKHEKDNWPYLTCNQRVIATNH